MSHRIFTKCSGPVVPLRAYSLEVLLACVVAAAVLTGCSAAGRLESTYGNKYHYFYSMVSPVRNDTLSFRDERLSIRFRFDDAAVGVQIQNISPVDLHVRWTGATIGIGGRTSGARIRNDHQDTTSAPESSPSIPPQGFSREALTRVNNMYFEGNRWRELDLLPTTDFNSPLRRDSILNLVKSVVDIVLPMEFGREKKLYRFTFAVDSVRRIPWSLEPLPDRLPRAPGAPRMGPTSNEQITAAILVAGFLGFSAYMLTAQKYPPVE